MFMPALSPAPGEWPINLETRWRCRNAAGGATRRSRRSPLPWNSIIADKLFWQRVSDFAVSEAPPLVSRPVPPERRRSVGDFAIETIGQGWVLELNRPDRDRKSTRLNSSH